ncbi:MAG: homoserine dehydrogenase [Phycisphaerales bacterium]|nr:homoserine dehydrogenase [Phycisphaerales bacterium]
MIRLLDTPVSISKAISRIAILGCGNVGSEVVRQLQSRSSIEVVSVLVRDLARERPAPRDLLTDSFDDVLVSRPDVVIELLGGVEPARTHIEAALQRGVPVVTANKSVIARHGESLHRIAGTRGVHLRYEAAVGAGVPVLAALDQLRGDRISAIRGIVNGTCNFILERVEKTRCSISEALVQAQGFGYAEPDPSADITGRDSAEKLCVLAHRAGWGWPRVQDVHTTGIESITAEDVQCALRQHCVIRLVAEAQCDGNGRLSLRVGPTLVPRGHALAAARGCENAFEIIAKHAGAIRLHGPGAGAKPTASAVISDLLAMVPARRHAAAREATSTAAQPLEEVPAMRRHYIRAVAPGRAFSPERVFAALNLHGIDVDTTELVDQRAVVHTMPVGRDRALALARHLVNDEMRHCLVAPYVEPDDRPVSRWRTRS